MNLSPDLREFIGLLNSQKVEYILVGAHTLAFHARPRYTGDLDIFVEASDENAARLVIVLAQFGFSSLGFKPSDFLEPYQVIQLGRPPGRIDLLTGLSGVSFEEAKATRVKVELDGLPAYILSKELLIQNKRATGRPQDLADLAELERPDVSD